MLDREQTRIEIEQVLERANIRLAAQRRLLSGLPPNDPDVNIERVLLIQMKHSAALARFNKALIDYAGGLDGNATTHEP